MSRYIDADKTLDALDELFDTNYWGNTALMDKVMDTVNNQKPADVAPVTHSHWKEYIDLDGNVYPECVNCGLIWWLDDGTAEDNEMFYCPKCGAKMDEKEEKDET